MVKSLFVIVFILFSCNIFAEEYEMAYEFDAISIDKKDFLQSINELYKYVASVNKDLDVKGKINLGNEDFSAELNLPIKAEEFDKFPRVSYQSDISIRVDSGLVSDVHIRLSDSWRKISIKGSSHDHVTGLVRIAQDKFSHSQIIAGGSGYRKVLAVVFYLLLLICLYPNWFNLKVRDWAIIYFGPLIFANFIIYGPSWEYVFPGFIVGQENSTFLEKYSPTFTFLGFFATLLVPAVGFITKTKKKTKPNK